MVTRVIVMKIHLPLVLREAGQSLIWPSKAASLTRHSGCVALSKGFKIQQQQQNTMGQPRVRAHFESKCIGQIKKIKIVYLGK